MGEEKLASIVGDENVQKVMKRVNDAYRRVDQFEKLRHPIVVVVQVAWRVVWVRALLVIFL